MGFQSSLHRKLESGELSAALFTPARTGWKPARGRSLFLLNIPMASFLL